MKTTIIVLLTVILAVLFVLGPFAIIWAMNQLFPALNIQYTLQTWCAVLIMMGALRPVVNLDRSK